MLWVLLVYLRALFTYLPAPLSRTGHPTPDQLRGCYAFVIYNFGKKSCLVSPTHKRAEGRAPVWGSESTTKLAALQGHLA
jgi:hypothetical protein